MTEPVPAGASPAPDIGGGSALLSRKEKRKAAKKQKRKQVRKEVAIREREEEKARVNDPEEQLRIRIREQEEAEVAERARKEFEERERAWLEAAVARKTAEEERQRREESQKEIEKIGHSNDELEDDGWELVEEGPAEIIWQGNEIIVKKRKVRVPKQSANRQNHEEDDDRPTSNPLPPQSEAYASYTCAPPVSAKEVLETMSQQIPNFGTEQDKTNCPFHLKTGACRFGSRCSRVHFHPDKSCTLLIKNMYNGPGLAWEQDEGLEYTDEEVEHCYEEFYEDVHTEFLKFGELINFKVCRNGSYHLRGNVYVHYKALESAILAFNAMNGRYFAGKQITCEFIGVTKWKVAICGEYMKSRLKTCSRGTACNFIHCFRNPGGDYEWADWDNPPPKYWIRKMSALFGTSDEQGHGMQMELESQERLKGSKRRTPMDNRCPSTKSTHSEMDYPSGGSDTDVDRNLSNNGSFRNDHSSGRKDRTLHKHKHYEDKHGSSSQSHSRKHHSRGHSSRKDDMKELTRGSVKKHRDIDEDGNSEYHKRHKKKHSPTEDMSMQQKGNVFGEQSKSSEYYKEFRLPDQYSDCSREDYHASSYRSSENLFGKENIDVNDRYDGKNCSDYMDSDKENFHRNKLCDRKCSSEEKIHERYASNYFTDHVSDGHGQDKKGKSTGQDAERVFSSNDNDQENNINRKSHDSSQHNVSTQSPSQVEPNELINSSEDTGHAFSRRNKRHSKNERNRRHHREREKYKDVKQETRHDDGHRSDRKRRRHNETLGHKNIKQENSHSDSDGYLYRKNVRKSHSRGRSPISDGFAADSSRE
ncbi:putative transcription factor C3H family [Dioscorea sansibarensis]